MKSKFVMPLLTSELMDQIIFAMEDQHCVSYLDLKENMVVSEDEKEEDEDEDRYLSLPLWNSAKGFLLMEKFAQRVRNPYYQEKLIKMLQSGHGVFRGFKDILNEQQALLQQWYGFKEHEMEKTVTAWYRNEQGSLALEPLEEDKSDEGLGDLLLEDFSILFSTEEDICAPFLQGLLSEFAESEVKRMLTLNLSSSVNKKYVLAKDANENICGLLVYDVLAEDAHLLFYGVEPKWRGIGLFRLMFDTLSRQLLRNKVDNILIDFGGANSAVLSMFNSLSQTEVMRRVSFPTCEYARLAKNSEQVFV